MRCETHQFLFSFVLTFFAIHLGNTSCNKQTCYAAYESTKPHKVSVYCVTVHNFPYQNKCHTEQQHTPYQCNCDKEKRFAAVTTVHTYQFRDVSRQSHRLIVQGDYCLHTQVEAAGGWGSQTPYTSGSPHTAASPSVLPSPFLVAQVHRVAH